MRLLAGESNRGERADEQPGAPTDHHDLVFVGAGASTAYVLLSLLAALSRRPPESPVRIGVVEREPDPFSGIAYGGRAARTSLLITSLRDFLPEDERALFAEWLVANKEWVFDAFLAEAGPFSRRWWTRHRAQIQRDEFDALYLPRYVFGVYLMQRTRVAITAAGATGIAATEVVRDEVCSILPADGSYQLRCRGGVLRAHRVVLAAGSPPVLPRLPEDSPPTVALIDDPFDGMGGALDSIRTALQRRRGAGDRPPHVVLIGGNAGTMDMLYQVNDLDIPEVGDSLFTILSPRGLLPERMDERDAPRSFVAERLQALEHTDAVDAASVYEAALGDIACGRAAGFSVGDTLRPISLGVGRLLPRLSDDQALEFAGRWGAELGRHQRRAGWEYCEVVEHLTADGRLRTVAGHFVDAVDAGPVGVRIRYEQGGGLHDLDPAADAVINCGGPAKRLHDAGSALLPQLVTSGVCRATPFGAGISVDTSLAAAPRLYVMGPLLAGNVVNGAPLWHMEHCGRISAFGSALGANLAQSLVAGPA